MKKLFAFLLILLVACDGGLNPETSKNISTRALLTGKINFINGKDGWPPPDSVYAIRVVAFKNYPPGDIIQEILTGNAFFTFNSLPFFVDSAFFSIEIQSAPVELRYIVVAQQYSDTITAQRAIGVYTESGDKSKPSPVKLFGGDSIFIEIEVDFNNLPPQPF